MGIDQQISDYPDPSLTRGKVAWTVTLTWVVPATGLATTSRKESLAVDSDRITKKTPERWVQAQQNTRTH